MSRPEQRRRGGYETVIGLEVHVQLRTATKLFCACPSGTSGASPNSAVCPVCTGQPGSLPVLNRKALEKAIVAALALGCRIRGTSVFARKSYFYPDLPKGYQISQYEEPLGEDGMLELGPPGGRAIRIRRVHMEEDAGKLLHAVGSRALPFTRVDLNRAGTPLIEVVTEPDLRTPEEASRWLNGLKALMQYCGVSACDMEKGEMRCDANISLRPCGQGRLGTKVELKNLNSFKAVRDALEAESSRQQEVLEEGGVLEQETRLWDVRGGRTSAMRSKEEEQDYRYFPDPDLPPVTPDPGRIDALRSALPERPAERFRRFIDEYLLSEYDAGVLTAERPLADYYEAVLGGCGKRLAKPAANWIQTELLALLSASGKRIEACPVPPEAVAELVRLIDEGRISGKIGKDVFTRMWETGKAPGILIEEQGLSLVQDDAQVRRWVEEAIEAHPQAAQDVRSGKGRAAGALVGAVMRMSGGRADPGLVNRMIKERLQ